jgi:hypothetical protein
MQQWYRYFKHIKNKDNGMGQGSMGQFYCKYSSADQNTWPFDLDLVRILFGTLM